MFSEACHCYLAVSTSQLMLFAASVHLLHPFGPIQTSVMLSAKKAYFRDWRWEALRIMDRLMTTFQTANSRIEEVPISRENCIEMTLDRHSSSNYASDFGAGRIPPSNARQWRPIRVSDLEEHRCRKR